jgi:hypothetical protein
MSNQRLAVQMVRVALPLFVACWTIMHLAVNTVWAQPTADMANMATERTAQNAPEAGLIEVIVTDAGVSVYAVKADARALLVELADHTGHDVSPART